jgi:hypothetical protein
VITVWRVRFDDGTPPLWVGSEDQALDLQEETGDTASVAPVGCEPTPAGILAMLNMLEQGHDHLLEPSH